MKQSGKDEIKFFEHAFFEGFSSRCASRRRKSVSEGKLNSFCDKKPAYSRSIVYSFDVSNFNNQHFP